MEIINKILTEFYPNHPEDMVIKNQFYPSGLREIDIYNYYISAKKSILKWINGRYIAYLLRIDKNMTVLKRKIKNDFITLTSHNFEDLITGRTNVIYVTQPENTNYFVIDIDPGENLSLIHSMTALKFLISNLNIINYEAIHSSSKGIHLIIPSKNHKISDAKSIIENALNEIVSNNKTSIKYVVNQKGRHANTINFDLSSMNRNGLHICRYSLTKEFLICDDVSKGLRRIKS